MTTFLNCLVHLSVLVFVSVQVCATEPFIDCPVSPIHSGSNGVSFASPTISGFRGKVTLMYMDETGDMIGSSQSRLNQQVILDYHDSSVITLHAEDKFGTRASCQFTIISEPPIRVTCPQPSTTVTMKDQEIAIPRPSVTDAHGSVTLHFSTQDNHHIGTMMHADEPMVMLSTSDLILGENMITVQATDSTGKSDTCQLVIYASPYIGPTTKEVTSTSESVTSQGSTESTISPRSYEPTTVPQLEPTDAPTEEKLTSPSGTTTEEEAASLIESTTEWVTQYESITPDGYAESTTGFEASAQVTSTSETSQGSTELTITPSSNETTTVPQPEPPTEEILTTPSGTTTEEVDDPDNATSTSHIESTTEWLTQYKSITPVGYAESTTGFEPAQADVTPPICEKNKDISRSLGPNADPSGTTINFQEPRATDDVSEPILVSRSHAPRDRFPAGTTRVTYTFRDEAGNTVDCGFYVILTENYLNMNFSPSQVSTARRNYNTLIRNMGGTFYPELLRQPAYYNTSLLPPLNREQELLIWDRYNDLFINVTEYQNRDKQGHGNQGQHPSGRDPRQAAMSRVCEVKPPEMMNTYMVTTSDNNQLAQLAQINSMGYFQWTFNEECMDSSEMTFSCKGSMTCHCGHVMRYQPALVFIFSSSGQPTNAILKTIKITSCVPMM